MSWNYIIDDLTENRREEFFEWAFGSCFSEIYIDECPKYWNDLHSEDLIISEKDDIYLDIKKMVNLWKSTL